jgi:ectoine hydroxylase-related dioxygenase (phytanoyl-CoA dioxygenase family)
VAELPVGGAVLYYGSTIHFAGANTTTDAWRRGVHVSYTLGWLRTEENNFLAVPPEVVATLSPEAQVILGYAVHDAIAEGGGYLGMVRMRDPRELLAEGELG